MGRATTFHKPATPNPMAAVMSLRNFRLLWVGQGTSLLGDQFYLIALPWLVLQRTDDPLTLGMVLAVASLPRAVLMLVGGAATDRFSPRAIMLVADWVRLVLIAGLTILVAADLVEMWMLYLFSSLLGVAAGFFVPASNAVVPGVVGKANLRAGNAISQGTAQLTQFIGPALAGAVIAWAGRAVYRVTGTWDSHNLEGVALALAFDAFTFLISILTLWRMDPADRSERDVTDNVMESIISGLRQFWGDPFIRFVLILMAGGGLLFTGTLLVGVPVLAASRLGGAAAFGLVMSGAGAGSLIGVLAAGVLPKQSPSRLRGLLVLLNLLEALGWVALAGVNDLVQAALVMVIIGFGMGYQLITFFTALQCYVPARLLGRLMSLVMLFNLGLTPVSQAVAGLILRWSLPGLFALTGGLYGLLILWAAFRPEYEMVGAILATPATNDGTRQTV